MLSYELLKFILSVVPTPHLSLDPVNPPRLSEQLILQCQATTIRGITSRLDFMWTRIDDDGEEVVQTVMGANHTNDSLVYTDIYTTPMALSESDVGTVYFCTISLNDDDGEILTNSLNITLDESIGKHMCMYIHYLYVLNIFNYMLNINLS